MADKPSGRRSHREELLGRIAELADKAIFGSISESYRTCGAPSCRCHHGGPKHGPHLSISYRSNGKTAGYHVPVAVEQEMRAGVEAWHALQDCLRELADLNSQTLLAEARKRRGTR